MKLDNRTKVIGYVILAVGAGILIRYLVRKKREEKVTDNALSQETDKDNKPNKPNKQEDKPTYTSESLKPKATISKETAKKYANTIYKALNGCGTDMPTIVATLKKLKNDADFNLLVEVYGTRTVSCWMAPSCTGGLIQNMKADMETNERNLVNDVLKDRGIKLLLPEYDPNRGFCS